MPEISVVIPTFNRAHYLAGTLASVFLQDYQDWELIVVDDGSTDGTPELLKTYGSRIRIVRQSNRGSGAARNAGIAVAKGTYVSFLDSDDRWFPWSLRVIHEMIRNHNNPALVAGFIREFRDEAELANVMLEPLRAEVFDDYLSACHHGYYVGSGAATIRRDVLIKSGGFTDRRLNGEDHDLILKMGTAAGFVQILAPATLGWRRHSASATAHVGNTAAGARLLVEHEQAGVYPGGRARARDRRSIITQHTRPASLQLLDAGAVGTAWAIYRSTGLWHLMLGRWRYLLGFPLLSAVRWLRGLA